jgi:hypothetical protein
MILWLVIVGGFCGVVGYLLGRISVKEEMNGR